MTPGKFLNSFGYGKAINGDLKMKIATWNLESARTITADRKAAFYDAIQKLDADVLILTETWMGTCLEPFSGYVVATQSLPAKDLTSVPERCWVAIWVKRTVSHTPVEIHAQQDRMAGIRIQIPEYADMIIVGTVLPWNSDKLWPGADGFCRAVAEQSSEWARIRAQNDDCTFLVAGDYNQSLPCVSRYGTKAGEAALSDALQKHDLLCLTAGNKTLAGTARIDHICISRSGLQSPFLPWASEWAVPVRNGSAVTDHVGIAIELHNAH